jgi:hypothetical protein
MHFAQGNQRFASPPQSANFKNGHREHKIRWQDSGYKIHWKARRGRVERTGILALPDLQQVLRKTLLTFRFIFACAGLMRQTPQRPA